ncbi:MAG: MerR family transcriptional regulator [Planctomycetota bacterium]|jgi:MerR family transcriptional regulator/heat shock protein HspR
MADPNERYEVDDPVMAIGVLAEKVGLSVSAVRKYEREGLLIAHRTDSGHRLFSHEDISRVRNIQYLIQELGLNIEGIRRMQALLPCWDLLPCSDEDRTGCPGHSDGSRPCWMIKGLPCAPKGNECRQCGVYRFGSLCTQDIKRLLFEGNGFKNGVRAKLDRLVQLRLRGEDIESG